LQATLAAANVASVLKKCPVSTSPDVLAWVDGEYSAIPKAAPSIVNAKDLGLETQSGGGSAY
jgi:glycerate dehydrogenase